MGNIFDIFKKIETPREPAKPVSFVIVGLGNPGEQYLFTRHNTGFLAIDYISQKLGVKVNRAKFGALYGDAEISGQRVLLFKPQTYMNESGRAVKEVMDFYKLPIENIVVISDDISLPVGKMRVRRSGSDGGQRGLRSIIRETGSDKFPRIRVGIGEKPNPEYDLADWVLSKFTPDEQKVLFDEFGRVYEGVGLIVSGEFDRAMVLCNTNNKG